MSKLNRTMRDAPILYKSNV